jgi:transposase
LEIYGHAVVRLPPDICHLNPVEFARGKIKRYVCEGNITRELSLQELLQVTKRCSSTCDKGRLGMVFRHTETVGKQCWERDGMFQR